MSRGLADVEVTPAAAIAASLAYRGELRSGAPLHLCYLAAAAQATGRLELAAERGTFAIQFKRGVVEQAASSAPEDDLGRFLVARGVLARDALDDAERVREGFGGDLVTALAQLKLINPAESFRVLQEHGAIVLGRALALERGAFRWDPAAKAPLSAFPLGSRWGVPCDAARRLDGLAVRKLLGDRAQRVAVRSGGRVELPELKLTAHEARAAALFDGRSSPVELAAAHPQDADALLRMALVLGEMELLAFGEGVAGAVAATPPALSNAAPLQPRSLQRSDAVSLSPPLAAGVRPGVDPLPARGERERKAPSTPARAPSTSASTPTRPSPSTSSSTPISPPSSTPTRAPAQPAPARPTPRPAVPQDVDALRATYQRLAEADHFEALGVKRDATTAQVKAAYFQLAKTYHPDAGPASEPAPTKRLRADIFARLGAAWRALGDDEARAAYARELESGGGAQVDVAVIFEAEQTFHKAVVLVRTRQYEKALAMLDQAVKLNAEEPEFAVWKAWVEFLVAADKKGQGAASAAAIEAALKMNPRCSPGYLFMGQMAKLLGDTALAEWHLKRGLAIDPEHAELARELRFLRR